MQTSVIAENQNWSDQAQCKGTDVEMFFSDVGTKSQLRFKVLRAKEICSSCPVRVECLRHSVEHQEEYGIWGGLTAQERGFGRRRNRY